MLADTLLVLKLLSLGDGQGALIEAKRVGHTFYYAKALALKGDTLKAINFLARLQDCRAKRYRLVLLMAKFYLEGAEDLLRDTSCFTYRDQILFSAYTLRFVGGPLSDSLKAQMPNLLDPSKAMVFNILPGAGLIYAGQTWKGIKTCAAVGIGCAGITYALRNRHYADACVWVLFWQNRFLTGSYQNTLEAVWQENRRRLQPYFQKILRMIEEGDAQRQP